MKVWKYLIPIQDKFTLLMPVGARPLTFQVQGGPTMWALVDPDAEQQTREFAVVGTGHADTPESGNYIGTIQHGAFVWHLFERECSAVVEEE